MRSPTAMVMAVATARKRGAPGMWNTIEQGGTSRRQGGAGGTWEIPRPGVSWVTMSWVHLSLRLAARAALRPALARALLVVAWRFRDRRWWRRAPFLPLPAREYVRWRMYTAYGDAEAIPPVDDVIRYARWAAAR